MFRSVKEFFSCYKKYFLEASCASLHFAAKAWKFVTHLCIYFVWRIKNKSIKLCLSIGESAFYSIKIYSTYILPKVVGFLQVLRFVPTRNVDRAVRIIKIWLTLKNLSNQRPVKRGKLKRIQNSFTSFLKRTKHLLGSIYCMFLSHIFSL